MCRLARFCPAELHLNENKGNRVSEAERKRHKEPEGPGTERPRLKRSAGPRATMEQSASNGFDILYMPEDSKHCVIIYK